MCSIRTFLAIFCLSGRLSTINTVYITFWSEANGKGKSVNYAEVLLHRMCMVVPETDFEVRSISTDACIQVFHTENCVGSRVVKIGADTSNRPITSPTVKSFAACYIKEEELNVYFYNTSNSKLEPVAKFEGLCRCINVPKELYQDEVLVETEGKQILFYENENCTGSLEGNSGGAFTLKKSFQPIDRPRNCLLLKGQLTDITTFKLTKTHNVTLRPLKVYPENFLSAAKQNVSVLFEGTDTKVLTFSRFPWTRHLVFCEVIGAIPIKGPWEYRWKGDNKILNDFLANHCIKQKDFTLIAGNQRLETNQAFNLTRNISHAAGVTSFTSAQRGYVIKYYEYRISVRITGTWEYKSRNVTADDLKRSLPLSGLYFVRKLDSTTILAETTEILQAEYPVSTLYKTVF